MTQLETNITLSARWLMGTASWRYVDRDEPPNGRGETLAPRWGRTLRLTQAWNLTVGAAPAWRQAFSAASEGDPAAREASHSGSSVKPGTPTPCHRGP